MVSVVHCFGSGPRRVWLLHGFTGSEHAFDHLEERLGAGLTAHVPRLPGHAGARAPESFGATARALARLIEAEDVLFGYSMGARLALAAVLLGGARPGRLVLESGSAGLRRRHERTLRRAEDEALAARLERDGVEAFMREWEARPLFAGLRRLAPAEREALASRRRAHDAAGLAAALRVLGLGAQPSLWAALARLPVPVLCLSGRRDEKFTALMGQVARAAPLGYHAVLEAGHAPHLECPEVWARQLIDFSTTPHPARPGRDEEAA